MCRSAGYEGPNRPDDSLTIYGNDGGGTTGRGFQTYEIDLDVHDRTVDHLNPQTTG